MAIDGASALIKRHAVTAGASDKGNAAEQDADREWNSQSFEDIQREIGRADAMRETEKGADT